MQDEFLTPGRMREQYAALAAGLIFLVAIAVLIEIIVPLALFGPITFLEKHLHHVTAVPFLLFFTALYLIKYWFKWMR